MEIKQEQVRKEIDFLESCEECTECGEPLSECSCWDNEQEAK